MGELTKYPSASSDTHTHKKKSVSMLLCPYGEIIRDHFKSTRQRKVRSIQPCLRIVGINKQKPGLIPPAPKTSILPTFQISKPVPNVLTTDMRNPWTTPSMLPKLHPSDENSNFQLLFARTTNKFLQNFIHKNHVYYKISFIKLLFTMAVNLSTTISLSYGHLSFPSFPVRIIPSYSFFFLPHYDTKSHIAVILIFLCYQRFKKKLFPILSFTII